MAGPGVMVASRGDASGGRLRAIQVCLFLAGEAGWLFAWSLALGWWLDPKATEPLIGAPGIVALLLAATVSTRLALARLRSLRLVRWLLALMGLGAALLVGASALGVSGNWMGPGDVWHALWERGRGLRAIEAAALTVLMWWRGLNAGGTCLSLDSVEAGFRTGTIALCGLFVVSLWAPSGETSTGTVFVDATLLVLFAGLIGMPLARILDLRESPRTREGQPLSVGGHWLSMLLGTVTALLLAYALTFQRIDALLRALAGPAEALLLLVVYAIALPIGLLVALLLALLGPFIHPDPSRESLRPLDLEWLEQLREPSQNGSSPELLILIAKATVVFVFAALVIWWLMRAVSRLFDSGSDDEVVEVRDFVWSWAEVRAALLAWLRALFGRRGRIASPEGSAASVSARESGPARDARALYREFLRLASRLARRRAPAQTPHEYERALAATAPFSDRRGELRTLTDLYAQARYGFDAPPAASMESARAALDRIKLLAELTAEDETPSADTRQR